MNIAIPKETKIGEHRIAIIPEHAKQLIDAGHRVFIEKDAGNKAGFPDQEYAKVGVQILKNNEIYNKEIVVRVKEPQLSTLRPNQTLMGYLHIEKGQNPELKNELLQKQITSYSFEEIRNPHTQKREISLGFEAGVVGMFEGLRHYGKILESKNQINPFHQIKSMKEYPTKQEAYLALRHINPNEWEANICIAGYGLVSKGCQEVLAQLSHPPTILKEVDTARTNIFDQEHSYIWNHLKTSDIFVNAIVWQPNQPRIITKNDLEMMVDQSLIIDISCDQNGGIETCTPTSWENPTYKIITSNGKTIHHYCVDNLPSAMANESSINLSSMVFPFVLKVANREEFNSGLMTRKGKYVFNSLQHL